MVVAAAKTANGSVGLLEVLEASTQEDLEQVREHIKTHESKLTALRQVERILDVRLNGAPAKAPSPLKGRPKGSIGASLGIGKGELSNKYRRDAAHMLLRGARRQADIAEECGIPSGSITAVLAHPWFDKNGDGSVALTNMGRQENAA